jgi:hypothetical protein
MSLIVWATSGGRTALTFASTSASIVEPRFRNSITVSSTFCPKSHRRNRSRTATHDGPQVPAEALRPSHRWVEGLEEAPRPSRCQSVYITRMCEEVGV